MAKNENTRLGNNHTLYLARSGYGKSQTLIRRSGIAPTGERVIYWDTNKDHLRYGNKRNATGYDSPGGFFKALVKCAASGRGYRIAYTGQSDIDLFEDVCAGVWDILDGRHMTRFVVEEYGAACEGPGPIQIKRHPFHKRLWQEGRKYGLIWDATSQRPQSISKDALENAGVIWAGNMGLNAAKRVAQEIDLRPDDLRALSVGEFYRWEPSSNAEKIRVFQPK